MKTDGTNVQVLVESPISCINVSDNWIYYANGSYVCKIKTDGSDNQTLCKERSGVADLHILDDWIYYYIYLGEDYLCRIKIDGTENQVFATLE